MKPVSELSGRTVVLGVSGGVAAYKSAELARLLVKAGADVRVVMTESAMHFVGPATFQAITGQAVWSDPWDARMPNGMAHIDLTRDAQLILIAPATADCIARLAQGRADDLLSTLCLARDQGCALMVAPAMNRQMWEHPATRRNVATLVGDGTYMKARPPANRPVAKSVPGAWSSRRICWRPCCRISRRSHSPAGRC